MDTVEVPHRNMTKKVLFGTSLFSTRINLYSLLCPSVHYTRLSVRLETLVFSLDDIISHKVKTEKNNADNANKNNRDMKLITYVIRIICI